MGRSLRLGRSKIINPVTCPKVVGVSMYRNVASRPLSCFTNGSLRGEHSAFDGQRDSGDVAAGVAGEEQQCGAEFFGLTETPA